MKVSDYIVEYLIKKGITDVFGYPGGMVTHLIDSLYKYRDKISSHVNYHEQGAVFSACGYAQTKGNIGVVYATSGPGATNLVTGICNAYFDSIPLLLITGQVNTFERRGKLELRQRGFQETDIVSMVKGVTKYAKQIDNADEIKRILERAYKCAMEGRRGPVLLDIPMDIFNANIEDDEYENNTIECRYEDYILKNREEEIIKKELFKATRPVVVIGNGLKATDKKEIVKKMLKNLKIPVVSTMLAIDILGEIENNYGFIGAYGSRVANLIIEKSDLVICLGTRLDIRQIGVKRQEFASNATLIRVDIDVHELDYKVHNNEIQILADALEVLKKLELVALKISDKYKEWVRVCNIIKSELYKKDYQPPNIYIEKISNLLPDNAIITTDVGQNQVWVAQSLKIKGKQEVYFSGGHGAMGYSLPASIGCCIATNRPTYSFNGDGGFQMNIQELQMIVREKLPIKIIILNNSSLGMIRYFQDMYFSNKYQTSKYDGYTVPDFEKIAYAYNISYAKIDGINCIKEELFNDDKIRIIEIFLEMDTVVYPKLEYGKKYYDQFPLLERKLFNYLLEL